MSSDSQQRVVCWCVVVGVRHGIGSKTRWENSSVCHFDATLIGWDGCPRAAGVGKTRLISELIFSPHRPYDVFQQQWKVSCFSDTQNPIHLHGHVAWVVAPRPWALKDPALGLILYCCHLESFTNF